MKHYKSPTGEVWAFEADGSQDHLIEAATASGMVLMTNAEVVAHKAPKVDPKVADKATLRELDARLTSLAIAEAIISGDMKPLKALVDKIKAAQAKL